MGIFSNRIVSVTDFKRAYPDAHEVDSLWGSWEKLVLDSKTGKYFETVWSANERVDVLKGYRALTISIASQWKPKRVQEQNRIHLKEPKQVGRPLYYGSPISRDEIYKLFPDLKKVAERVKRKRRMELLCSEEDELYFCFKAGDFSGSYEYFPIRIKSLFLWRFGF